MKKITRLLFLAILFLVSSASDTPPVLPDSLFTIDQIYNYTFTDYDKSVAIARQMRQRKLEPAFKLDMAEGDLHFNNGKYHQALTFYSRALESDSVAHNDERTLKLLHRFISVYDALHNEQKKAQYIDKLLHKAREAGDPVMESIAQFNMGKMLYEQKDKERGYRLIHEAIRLMEQADYEYKNDNLIYDYNTLYIMQQRDQDFEEALKTLDKLADLIAGITDNDFNMQGIYRKELKTMYAHRAFTLAKLGRMAEAARAYDNWKEMGNINDKDNYLITSYLMTIGQYDRIIHMNRAQEDFLRQHSDTITYHMRTLKRTSARAYEAKGDYKNAMKCFDELAVLTDSLKTREQRSAALELATVYETAEKEALIQQNTADLRLRNLLLASAVVVISLLAVLLWRNVYYTRVIRRKNTAMVHTINELMEYKNEEREQIEARPYPRTKEEDGAVTASEAGPGTGGDTPKDNKALFEKLNQLIISRKLYLERNLTREDLMLLIGVDKNRFAQLIKEETGTNLTGYLNTLRLDGAVILLKDHPDMSIAEVAERCALPNTSTFYRVFKEKYGMTPVEFRDVRTK